jgi:hypothetical protein
MWKYIFSDYLVHHRLDGVLMSGRWDEGDFDDLAQTIGWLKKQGVPVVLFGPVMEFDIPLPRLLTMSIRDERPAELDQHSSREPLEIDRKLAELARKRWGVRYVSTYENLCQRQLDPGAATEHRTKQGCPVYGANGVPLLFDTDHFTPAGSILFAKSVKRMGQLP